LTDGAIWRLYRHAESGPALVDELTVSPTRVDDRRFRWWLGAVLATEQRIQPTAATIAARLGARNTLIFSDRNGADGLLARIGNSPRDSSKEATMG
jgi:hypothetical protein